MYSLIIIDDEEEILEGLANYFPWKSIGFEVIGAFSYASAALDFCEKIMPDVVLTDIRLPFKSGFDILDELSKKETHPLFCVMSAYDEFEYAKQAIKYGVQDYLVKPVSLEELTKTFNKIKGILDSKSISVPLNDGGDSDNRLVRKTIEIIRKRTKDCTLSSVAEELEVSESYLSRLFKKETGTNFQKYLQDVKMSMAASMLEPPAKYKNKDIAEALGYTDSQNFCRTFRKVYGMTPQEYRESRKKDK
ncbi:MAG: helix-turn-helix domain-containing protein [Spirochaetales bacterium]|nr:helix-turn-helix domain-containing protein [Candidatus Physcosoma equi]